jgi:hypothetical protein
MKVKFAVQTLSKIVCNGLKFAKGLNLEGFQGCEATAQICLNFNNTFDISNGVNYTKLSTEVNRLLTYIEN